MKKQDVLENRKFAWVVGGVLIAFAFVSFWKSQEVGAWIAVAVACGFSLAIAGALAPANLTPLRLAWLKLGHALGWVNSRIILGVVFFVVVFPIGLVLRLTGRDGMHRKFSSKNLSYRDKSVITDPKEGMRRPF